VDCSYLLALKQQLKLPSQVRRRLESPETGNSVTLSTIDGAIKSFCSSDDTTTDYGVNQVQPCSWVMTSHRAAEHVDCYS
jgi:hypothetical protein